MQKTNKMDFYEFDKDKGINRLQCSTYDIWISFYEFVCTPMYDGQKD